MAKNNSLTEIHFNVNTHQTIVYKNCSIYVKNIFIILERKMTLQIVWIFYKHIDVTKSSRIKQSENISLKLICFFFSFSTPTGPPSAPVSAHSSRVDLSNLNRPSGSVIYLGRTNSSNTGSRLSLVSRSSSLSSPHSSPKHRPRQ